MKTLRQFILESVKSNLLPALNDSSVKTFLNDLLKSSNLNNIQLDIIKKMAKQIKGKSTVIDFDVYPRGYKNKQKSVVAAVGSIVGVITGEENGLICMCINDYEGKYCIFDSNSTILINKDKYYIIDKCIFNSSFSSTTAKGDFNDYFDDNIGEDEIMAYGLANLIEIPNKVYDGLSSEEQIIVSPLCDNEYSKILIY